MMKKPMRILWLCNIVLPDFASKFEIKENPYGGWMTGMLHEMEKEDGIEIALIFPIRDEARMHDGIHQGHPYFSFQNDSEPFEVNEDHIDRFRDILTKYKPDMIHIWGTEYAWALEMMRACEKENLLEHALVHIQGLVANYARYFAIGLPDRIPPVFSGQSSFQKQGINERTVLERAWHIAGRTEWDQACVQACNPTCRYHVSTEILRESFYQSTGMWSMKNMIPHQIFVSQASYPIKGFHFLLRALPIILKQYPDMQVRVAGEDIIHVAEPSPYARFIAEEMERLEVKDAVTFLGRQNETEMIAEYRKANVFVSASLIENSPNSICEAMLIGTPVIASYVGGVPDLIRHGDSGFLYQSTEYELIAFYVLRCFSDRRLCENLSRNAINFMTEYVSRDKGVHRLLGIYTGISREYG